MAEKTDVTAHGGVVRGEVDAEHRGLSGGDGQQPGTGAQQARLARTVRPDDDDHLARLEGKVHPGEGGKAARESDRGAELDDEGHGLGPPW